MFTDPRSTRPASASVYWHRVLGALDRSRLGVAAVVTLIVSLRLLIQPDLFDFFTPLDLLLAWAQHFAELALIAAVLLLVYTLLDEALRADAPGRTAVLLAALLATSVLAAFVFYRIVLDAPPPALLLASESLRFALPALLLAGVAEYQRRAARTAVALRDAEAAGDRRGREETERQLQLLQAQLEPHFLFNTLANVRRLYRTDPEAGTRAIDSLLTYLRAALPELRRDTAKLHSELELVRSYLELFRLRMGRRLTYSIAADPALLEAEFPPMLLVTLVENAIKHGIEPTRDGGHVAVSAQTQGATLEVRVSDNGVGFGGAASSGTGLGLANVQRQLATRYGSRARLDLAACVPHGVMASIALPWRHADPAYTREASARP
jgi:two-component sensor histidine kinase